MSQTDPYRSAVLPSEAAMIPAVEVAETTPPAAESTPTPSSASLPAQPPAPSDALGNAPATDRQPARTNASRTLERIRNRTRGIRHEGLQWMDAQHAPLGGAASAPAARPANARPDHAGRQAAGQQQPRQTTSGGAALSTLMRSAARRYAPPPAMRVPPTGGPGRK